MSSSNGSVKENRKSGGTLNLRKSGDKEEFLKKGTTLKYPYFILLK
jgi:hypothetical protein